MKIKKILYFIIFFSIIPFINGTDDTLLNLLGTPSENTSYPPQTIYAALNYCYNYIGNNPRISFILQRFGSTHFIDNNAKNCDNVTVFAKTQKIRALLEKIEQLHDQPEELLVQVSDLFGTPNDLAEDQTIFGSIQRVTQTIQEFDQRNSSEIEGAIGDLNGTCSTRNLIEILNQTIYILSLEDSIDTLIMQENSLKKQLEKIASALSTKKGIIDESILHRFGNTSRQADTAEPSILSYFSYVCDALQQTAPFLEIEDIEAIKNAIGSEQDQSDTTLYGIIQKINESLDSSAFDSNTSLKEFIGDPNHFFQASPNLIGKIYSVYHPIRNRFIAVLSSIQPFNCLQLSSKLLTTTQHYLDPTIHTRLSKLVAQIQDVTQQIEHPEVSLKWNNQLLCESIMQMWNILYQMNLTSYDETICASFIGEEVENQSNIHTLSDVTKSLVQSFYLENLSHRIRNDTNLKTLLAVANTAGELINNSNIDSLWRQMNFGNYAFSDVDPAGTLYQNLTFLQDAIESTHISMNSSLYLQIIRNIGSETDTQNNNSIFGYLNDLILALQTDNTTDGQRFIHSCQSLVQKLLYILYRDAFSASLLQAYNNLMFYKNPVLASILSISTVLEDINFPSLISQIQDKSHSLTKDAVTKLYYLIGRMSGDVAQQNLAGNVLFLKTQLDQSEIKSIKQSQEQIGQPEDLRESIKNPMTNTLYGNINWLRNQIETHYICSCLPAGDSLFSLAESINWFNHTLHCITDNINPLMIHCLSTQSIDQCLTYLNDQASNLDEIVESLAQTIHHISSAEPDHSSQSCQMVQIIPMIDSLDLAINNLNTTLQSLLPKDAMIESATLDPIDDTNISECEFLHKVFNVFNVIFANTQQSIQEFLNSFQNIPFLSWQPNILDSINDIQNHFKNIQNYFKNIQNYFDQIAKSNLTLCFHHSPQIKIDNLTSTIQTMIGDIDAFKNLSGLCCSLTDYLIYNISELSHTFPEILSSIFIREDLDKFIRNQAFDHLFCHVSLALQHVLERINSMFNICDQFHTSYCESHRLEQSLIQLTDDMMSIIRGLQEFMQNHLDLDITAISQYNLPNDTVFRCKSINHHLDAFCDGLTQIIDVLSTNPENSILNAIKNSATLSYSPPLINSLQTTQQTVSAIAAKLKQIRSTLNYQNVFCKLCYQEETLAPIQQNIEKIADTFETFSLSLSDIIKALQKPRCCSETADTLLEIQQSISSMTPYLCQFIESFADPRFNSNQQYTKETFTKIGDEIKSIASSIDAISNKILSIGAESVQQRCCMNHIQPIISEQLLLHVNQLKEHLTRIYPINNAKGRYLGGLQGTYLVPNTSCLVWPEYLYFMMESLKQWENSFSVLKDHAQAELHNVLYTSSTHIILSSTNACDYFKNHKNCYNLFLICDAISYLIPFFHQVSQSISNLVNVFNYFEKHQYRLCSACDLSHLKNALIPIEFCFQNILSPLKILANIFETIKTYNLNKYNYLNLIENSSEWELVNENNDAFYQCTKNKDLFITLTKPSETPNALNIQCTPYFSYQENQVIWNEDGQILNEDLTDYQISDFVPISVTEYLHEIKETMELIQKQIKNVNAHFSDNFLT